MRIQSLILPVVAALAVGLALGLLTAGERLGPWLHLTIALGLIAIGLGLWATRTRPKPEPTADSAEKHGQRPPSLAFHDPLTKLPNRAFLYELLHKQIAQAQRTGDMVGVVISDVDRLKAINDRHGHAVGDGVLGKVAERIAADVREADVLGRTGGDEFTLVVTRAQRAEDVLSVAKRLASAFEKPVQVRDQEILVSASIGVSIFPDDGPGAEELLSHAESALAKAKAEGGNSLRLFASSMNRKARLHAALEQDLRQALRRGQLVIHLQPQIALDSGRIAGMEALVRWPHPRKGLIPAGTFIPLAEDAGLMPELGSWLLREICRQNARWLSEGLPCQPISVNLSVRQLQAGDVAAVVQRALRDSGLEARYLHLEVTESIAMHEIDRASESLSRIQELGVKIHLDDFGTGYSSLSYLLSYPVDVLKIDRSFVAGLPHSEQSVNIVRLTISLAKSLNLGLIAEGVETREQLEFLRQEGCPAAQGYLLGRPMPVEEAEKLLVRGAVSLQQLSDS